MKLCSSCHGPICDFCAHYAFNGDKIEGFETLECFNGDGFCQLNGDDRDPSDECENFLCRNQPKEFQAVELELLILRALVSNHLSRAHELSKAGRECYPRSEMLTKYAHILEG